VCSDLGLDCSKTCCNGTGCAAKINDNDCTSYETRDYIELYVGFGTILALFTMIPLCIKIVNCLMLYKFCKRFDEMSQVYWGGYSICDCCSMLCFCCCYKRQPYEYESTAQKEEEER